MSRYHFFFLRDSHSCAGLFNRFFSTPRFQRRSAPSFAAGLLTFSCPEMFSSTTPSALGFNLPLFFDIVHPPPPNGAVAFVLVGVSSLSPFFGLSSVCVHLSVYHLIWKSVSSSLLSSYGAGPAF